MEVEYEQRFKEKRCRACKCNLIITRKYSFFKHRRGKRYFICLDCDEECEIEWVDVEAFDEGVREITQSARYARLTTRIEHLRGVITRKEEWIDKMLLRSLED